MSFEAACGGLSMPAAAARRFTAAPINRQWWPPRKGREDKGVVMILRVFRTGLLAAALTGALAPLAQAQAPYPNQTIKVIVPNPPGGLPDTISRIVGKRLQERVGQPVIVENRPGANSGIGTAAMTQAP